MGTASTLYQLGNIHEGNILGINGLCYRGQDLLSILSGTCLFSLFRRLECFDGLWACVYIYDYNTSSGA